MIFFTGFCCAGKTSVGKICAKKLVLPFYDTDHLIEELFGMNMRVSDIWKQMGSARFRDLEKEVLLSLKGAAAIIALGGGTLLCHDNREHIKKLGFSIYLKATPKTLFKRVLNRSLPAFLDTTRPVEHFNEICAQRFPIYEKHCTYMIETDNLTEQQVANQAWEAIVSDIFSASPPGENLMVERSES